MRERLIMMSKQAEQEAELQARFSKMAKRAEEMPPTPKESIKSIKKDDWVGLRLLSLMLSTDVSAINIKDVKRSVDYYERRYSSSIIAAAFAQLNRERAENGEWRNPESKALWERETMLKHVGEDLGWKEENPAMWIRRK